MVAVSMVWREVSGLGMAIKLWEWIKGCMRDACDYIIIPHNSKAKFRAARTTFYAYGSIARFERGGRGPNFIA